MSEKHQEIIVAIGCAYEFHKTDWNGRIIEDTDNVFTKMQCTLKIDDVRCVAFGIDTTLPRDRLKEPDETNIKEQLNCFIRVALEKYLSDSRSINLFQTHLIPLIKYLGNQLPDTILESTEYLVPFNCMISNKVYEDLNSQYDTYIAACKSFDYAVEKLSNFAEYDPASVKYYQSELFSLIAFIDRSLAAADVGQLYSWYREKQSGIRRNFNDMLRRKQSNHPGYRRAQEYIRSNLYSYHTPAVWNKKPPILQVID